LLRGLLLLEKRSRWSPSGFSLSPWLKQKPRHLKS
jgi:hypothetical protein